MWGFNFNVSIFIKSMAVSCDRVSLKTIFPSVFIYQSSLILITSKNTYQLCVVTSACFIPSDFAMLSLRVAIA